MLDPNGNRTAVVSNAGTETYTLDALNRLTNVTYPGALTETFAYDAAGNRTSHSKTDGTTVGFTVDATGQLTSDTSGTTYTYDAAGNLTGTSDGESYSYDDYGRHTSISAGGVTQTYGYDAQDVRVTVDGQTQLWDRNGGLPTLISTSGGDNYVHTAGVSRDGDGWLLADAVGSVRTVVDNTGTTTGSQSFTAFGEQLTGSGTFGFAGEQQDPTGLQHLRARQYNPALGRFITVDPVQPGAPGTTGYNLYAYSGNNPTTWTDPSGQTLVDTSALNEHSQRSTAGLSYGVGTVGRSAFVRLSNALARKLLGIGVAACVVACPSNELLPQAEPRREPLPPEAPQPAPPRTFAQLQLDLDLGEDERRSDCHVKAADAAYNLPAVAWSTWFALNNRSRDRGRNVAAVSYCINGHFGVSAAVSGFSPPNGTIPQPASPRPPPWKSMVGTPALMRNIKLRTSSMLNTATPPSPVRPTCSL